jgi:hypothetical protein
MKFSFFNKVGIKFFLTNKATSDPPWPSNTPKTETSFGRFV